MVIEQMCVVAKTSVSDWVKSSILGKMVFDIGLNHLLIFSGRRLVR